MSQSIFPTLISNTFIPALWTFPSSQITAEYLNSNFLKYPVGQGSQTIPDSLIITDGTTANTITNLGYTTKNTTQNTLHFANFSDSSLTGIGAIQKSANFLFYPSTTSNGRLGINIPSGPAYPLDVVGDVRFATTSSSKLGIVRLGNTGVGTTQSAYFNTNGTDVFLQNQENGSLQLGTNNINGQLTIASSGAISATGSITANGSISTNKTTLLYSTIPSGFNNTTNINTNTTIIGERFYVTGAGMTFVSGSSTQIAYTITNIGVGVWLFQGNYNLTGQVTTSTLEHTTSNADLTTNSVRQARCSFFNAGASIAVGNVSFVFVNNIVGFPQTLQTKMSGTGHTFSATSGTNSASLIRIA